MIFFFKKKGIRAKNRVQQEQEQQQQALAATEKREVKALKAAADEALFAGTLKHSLRLRAAAKAASKAEAAAAHNESVEATTREAGADSEWSEARAQHERHSHRHESDGSVVQILESNVYRHKRHIQRALRLTLRAATYSCFITSPYFIPPMRTLCLRSAKNSNAIH